jgi:hypothetical protein
MEKIRMSRKKTLPPFLDREGGWGVRFETCAAETLFFPVIFLFQVLEQLISGIFLSGIWAIAVPIATPADVLAVATQQSSFSKSFFIH